MQELKRRDINKILVCLALVLLTMPMQASDVISRYAPAPKKIEKQHPYLYADDKKFETLKKSEEPTVVILRNLVFANADKALEKKVLPVPENGSNMGYMRSVQGRLIYLSAAYKMSGEYEYLEAVRRQLKELNAIEDWGTYHFLDIGEAALGVGIAYDWLYDEWTKDEKKAIEESVLKKCFATSKKVHAGKDSWMKGDFNWNQVCHGGLSVAALAIYNTYPEEAKFIIERAAECVPYAAKVYEPDGAYPEGASYWEYGTTFQVLLIEAMRSAFGHCYGLNEYEGFMESADFRIQLNGNIGLEYGYSDYHKGYYNEPVMMWYAKELGRSDLQQNELEKIECLLDNPTKMSRLSFFDLLWWNPIKTDSSKVKGNLQCWQANGKMPIAFMRTDCYHNHAYVGFKGGTPYHSHGHQDSGSFIYESQGVRWALDLGTENYDKMRKAQLDLWNYEQNSSRWTAFRTSAEAHNLARIDSDPLITLGVASDMEFVEKMDCGVATLDITLLYDRDKVESVKRTVRLNQSGDMVVSDAVKAKKSLTLTSQWITDADVTAMDKGVRLTKNGKQLLITSDGIHKVTVDDVSLVSGIQNSRNPGVKRVRFIKRMKASASDELTLEITNIK